VPVARRNSSCDACANAIDENAHTRLLLLAATLDDERIARASELLRSTSGGRERAVLLEALEAVLPADEGRAGPAAPRS
jgi:hypothetical protein